MTAAPASSESAHRLRRSIQGKEYNVSLGWDKDALVWTAENSEIPFALCFPLLDGLIERSRYVADEMLAENGKQAAGCVLNFPAVNRSEPVYG